MEPMKCIAWIAPSIAVSRSIPTHLSPDGERHRLRSDCGALWRDHAQAGAGGGQFRYYPMLHLAQMPKISVSIIEGAEQPGGIGEADTPSIAPTVANTIFAPTGKRLRSLPIVKQGVNVT